jgi:hypothetical protein
MTRRKMTLTKNKDFRSFEYNDHTLHIAIDFIREQHDGTYKVVGNATLNDEMVWDDNGIAYFNYVFDSSLKEVISEGITYQQRFHSMIGLLSKILDHKTFEFDLIHFYNTLHQEFVKHVRAERLAVVTSDKYVMKLEDISITDYFKLEWDTINSARKEDI